MKFCSFPPHGRPMRRVALFQSNLTRRAGRSWGPADDVPPGEQAPPACTWTRRRRTEDAMRKRDVKGTVPVDAALATCPTQPCRHECITGGWWPLHDVCASLHTLCKEGHSSVAPHRVVAAIVAAMCLLDRRNAFSWAFSGIRRSAINALMLLVITRVYFLEAWIYKWD